MGKVAGIVHLLEGLQAGHAETSQHQPGNGTFEQE